MSDGGGSDTNKDIWESLDLVWETLPNDGGVAEAYFVDLLERLRTELRKPEAAGRLRPKDRVEAILGTWISLREPAEMGDGTVKQSWEEQLPSQNDLPTQGAWALPRPWASPAH